MRSGENASAGGTTTLVGQSVSISGVIDSATFDATSRTVKKGLLSKKVTTTTQSSSSQTVVASTVSGDRVNVVATGGDVSVRGSNVVSDNPVLSGVEGGTLVQATGAVTIGTLEARSSESQSVKVKKSGISLSGAGLFAGVAKSTNASTLDTVTNTGSVVGSANGDVTVNAGKALTITASQVAAPGTVNLRGESVTIQNATDTANSTSLSKSSSFGVSIKAQSNVVDAVKTVSRLTEIGTTTSNARVAAVSAVAGGLAVANGIDAAKDAASAIKSGTGSLGTATLTASDIRDSAKSKDISVGISASINNVTDRNTRSANLPVVDGSLASSTFKQDTKATIGQGVLSVGVPDSNVVINRDVGASQVVTKDKQTGFTVNIDVAAIREVAALLSGDKQNSVILQGVNNIANDPLRVVKDVAGEIKSLSDGERKSGALELLIDKIDTLIPGFTKREAPRLTVDFIKKLADVLPDGTIVTAEQKAETVAAIAAVGGFEAAAEVERQFTGIGRDLNLDPAQTKDLRTKTEAFIAAGDNSPEAKARFETELETIIVIGCKQPCAVSDINDPKIKSLFGVVVVATEKVGGAFNNASPLTQKLIGYGLTALGGVKGVVEEVVLSVAPTSVQNAIGKAGEAITVGADALLRNESFGTIASQNANKSGNNPTFNQTTGIGLATSIVAIGGVAKAVGGGGKGGGADTPDPVGGNPSLGDLKGADPFTPPVLDIPRFTKGDFLPVGTKISPQRQERHLEGGAWQKP